MMVWDEGEEEESSPIALALLEAGSIDSGASEGRVRSVAKHGTGFHNRSSRTIGRTRLVR